MIKAVMKSTCRMHNVLSPCECFSCRNPWSLTILGKKVRELELYCPTVTKGRMRGGFAQPPSETEVTFGLHATPTERGLPQGLQTSPTKKIAWVCVQPILKRGSLQSLLKGDCMRLCTTSSEMEFAWGLHATLTERRFQQGLHATETRVVQLCTISLILGLHRGCVQLSLKGGMHGVAHNPTEKGVAHSHF